MVKEVNPMGEEAKTPLTEEELEKTSGGSRAGLGSMIYQPICKYCKMPYSSSLESHFKSKHPTLNYQDYQ
jgi:hypothetical protein